MFWLEGGIELLTPRQEPAILSTRPEGITLNVNDFIKIYTTRPKIKNFFWHHARYYRHLVPKYKLKNFFVNPKNPKKKYAKKAKKVRPSFSAIFVLDFVVLKPEIEPA